MHQENLAIASVPVQSWGAIYEPQKALLVGTIFQDLDLPFYLAESDVQSSGGAAACIRSGKSSGGATRNFAQSANMTADLPNEMPPQTPSETPFQTPSGIPGGVTEVPIREPGKIAEVPMNTPGKFEEQEKRETMLCQIYAVSFALDDIRLYMDTHPGDKSGLELLKETVKTRKRMLKDFAARFYPLTMDCMAEIYEQNPASECYCWEKGPLPWEGACV